MGELGLGVDESGELPRPERRAAVRDDHDAVLVAELAGVVVDDLLDQWPVEPGFAWARAASTIAMASSAFWVIETSQARQTLAQ